ncbi:hypothetical protein HNQ76_000374 [Thermosulfuriphilus ammonigenes]|nr:hypothetical protein [Thermosulfuriphilus ammonigenes]
MNLGDLGVVLAVFVIWLGLNRIILPRLGVPT